MVPRVCFLYLENWFSCYIMDCLPQVDGERRALVAAGLAALLQRLQHTCR